LSWDFALRLFGDTDFIEIPQIFLEIKIVTSNIKSLCAASVVLAGNFVSFSGALSLVEVGWFEFVVVCFL
jgi:hypothetical protein